MLSSLSNSSGYTIFVAFGCSIFQDAQFSLQAEAKYPRSGQQQQQPRFQGARLSAQEVAAAKAEVAQIIAQSGPSTPQQQEAMYQQFLQHRLKLKEELLAKDRAVSAMKLAEIDAILAQLRLDDQNLNVSEPPFPTKEQLQPGELQEYNRNFATANRLAQESLSQDERKNPTIVEGIARVTRVPFDGLLRVVAQMQRKIDYLEVCPVCGESFLITALIRTR